MDSPMLRLGVMFIWYLNIGIILLGSTVSATVVQTTHGPVEGKTMDLSTGKKVDAFLGVPFAAPPIKNNRFVSPQPLKNWTETLKVQSLPKSCVQTIPESARKDAWYASESEESEDCLYLNLWVPEGSTNAKKAIMIWIYGGAFVSGSSNLPLYDGSVLASENDVIVASMNYRLAMFGFLFLNTTEVHGNAGLQDQIKAIEWIKDNAQSFGGDPERITLFGESSGSISVTFHMVNPKLDDLFKYAVFQSATLYMFEEVKTEAVMFDASMSLAEGLGCSCPNINDTLDCMRQKSLSEIVKADKGILPYIDIAFVPVKNGIEVPLDIEKAIQDVPPEKRKYALTGNIVREMNDFITDFFPGKVFDDNFTVSEDDMRDLLSNWKGISDSRLQDIFLHEYRDFDVEYDRNQLRIEATELVNDNFMLCPCLRFVQNWTKGQTQVYFYYFTHQPSKEYKVPVPNWTGVVHGDEIPFVFGRPLEPENKYTADEVDLSKKMMTYWSNFAKTGNPNGEILGSLTWPSVSPGKSLTYMELDLNFRVRTSLKERKCDFWNNVYPSIVKLQDQIKASSST